MASIIEVKEVEVVTISKETKRFKLKAILSFKDLLKLEEGQEIALRDSETGKLTFGRICFSDKHYGGEGKLVIIDMVKEHVHISKYSPFEYGYLYKAMYEME